MFSICKSESTKSSCRILGLKPLKQSIAERILWQKTLELLSRKLRLSNFLPSYLSAVVLNTLIRHSVCGREN